ncbi:hypothetical protein Q8W71_32695 [Methylobacterium sp. NEAU 140]|uniref:hypothetical protein n=1 Tax=Methylobacterium sp. NEAU 140 TaxID=3064945 RepID=UPI002735F958|nr:hypothetical protein [Methylobacterium sp. NEAU 140]MDP4027321.1 hypothetical protein [Methylobacterium sp. NEAU 140]
MSGETVPNRSEAGDPGERARAIIAEKTTALRAARAGVWTYDPGDDRLRYCLGAARAFGLPSETRLIGLPLADLAGAVHPDDGPHYRAQVSAPLRSGRGIEATLRTRPDGDTSRQILLRGTALPDDSPHGVQVSGIVVELPEEDTPAAPGDGPSLGPGTPPGAPAPGLVQGIEHLLAGRACLAEGPGPERKALPLIDVLLRELGRILAQSLHADDRRGRDPGERG